jgi:hypothetical protein
MPVTKVQAPSGAIIDVQHPAGATKDEIMGYARANFMENVKAQAGDEKYKRAAMEDGVGTNMAAAFGGAVIPALTLGVKGLFGANKPGEVQEWKDSMSGLTDTAGGKVGALLGFGAPAAATAMLPGGQTVLGSLLYGGGLGAVMPAEDGSERVRNMVSSAGFNAALPAVVATGKTLAAVGAPMTQAGSERVAGRVLERFATNPASVRAAGGGRTMSGTFPTLAEETGDLGVANLQQILMSRDPRQMIAGRYADNNAARVNTLTAMGGTDDALARSQARRSAIGGSAYDRARAAGVNQPMADAMRPQIENLLERPAIQRAMAAAEEKARNEGLAIGEFGSPTGLQYLKQELDDLALTFPPGSNNRRIHSQLSGDVDSVLREIVPDLKRADRIYARLSREPNRMEVARELNEQTTTALRDFNGQPSLLANKFATTLDRRSPKVVSTALGRRGESTIEDVMSANQNALLDDLRTGVERQAAATKNRTGQSQTARNLIGDDIVGRIAGPLGVPQSWAQSALAENFLKRPTSWLLRSSEERLNDTLLRAITDPAYAAMLAQRARPTPLSLRSAQALENASPVLHGGLLGSAPLLLEPR